MTLKGRLKKNLHSSKKDKTFDRSETEAAGTFSGAVSGMVSGKISGKSGVVHTAGIRKNTTVKKRPGESAQVAPLATPSFPM